MLLFWAVAGQPPAAISLPPTHPLIWGPHSRCLNANYGRSNTRDKKNSQKMFQGIEEEVLTKSFQQVIEGFCKQPANKRSWTCSYFTQFPPIKDRCENHYSSLSDCKIESVSPVQEWKSARCPGSRMLQQQRGRGRWMFWYNRWRSIDVIKREIWIKKLKNIYSHMLPCDTDHDAFEFLSIHIVINMNHCFSLQFLF